MQPPRTPEQSSFDLLDYLSVVWKHKQLVAGLTLIATLTAGIVSFTKSPVYTATTSVLVKPTALNPQGSIPLTSTIVMPTEIQIVSSNAVLSSALAGSGTLGSVSAVSVADSQVLLISCSAGDAGQAASCSSAVAAAYLNNRKHQAIDDAQSAIAQANDQIHRLQAELSVAEHQAATAKPGSADAIAAESKVQQLNGQIAIWQSSASLVNIAAINPGSVLVAARIPTSPSSPNHKKDIAAGFLLGLVLGIAAALVKDRTDRGKGAAAPAPTATA